jgi:hypothetical protein
MKKVVFAIVSSVVIVYIGHKIGWEGSTSGKIAGIFLAIMWLLTTPAYRYPED